VAQEIVELVPQMAKQNPTKGYNRIQGALANLGHAVSDNTVGNILKANGIEPAPDRSRRSIWKSFLEAHWDVLASVDFTTIVVWTKSGLVTYYLLFFMELATRREHLVGLTANSGEAWMLQPARNVTDHPIRACMFLRQPAKRLPAQHSPTCFDSPFTVPFEITIFSVCKQLGTVQLRASELFHHTGSGPSCCFPAATSGLSGRVPRG
jgi:hypothetical protein